MRKNIQIYINQTVGSAFLGINHRAELRRRYQAIMEFPNKYTDSQVLNEVHRVFNLEHPSDYTGSSLSVADVVTLNDGASYEVAELGFTKLPFLVTGDTYIVNFPEPTISQIKEWRQTAHNAGKPNGIEDFYRSLNMCRRCRGKGHMTGYPPNSCTVCSGSGTYPATDEERILAGLRNMTRPLKSKAR